MKMPRRTFIAISALAPFATLLAKRDSLAHTDIGKRSPAGRTIPAGRRRADYEGYFPNVVLRTHENKAVRFYDDLIKDKIVVISFIYTKCEDDCPLTTANLVRVQKLLGDRVGRDIFMYSITLDPEHDTPAVLKKYAETFGVGPGWRFLTGQLDDVELLRQKLGFTDPDPVVDADKSSHIGMVLYGNEALTRWAACPCLSKPEVMVEYIGWMDGPKN